METLLLILKVAVVVAEVLVGIAAFVAPMAMIGGWILAPIDRAAKFRQAPVRFSIGDFLCLFLAIQIPLSAVYRFIGRGEERPFWMFFVISWIVGSVVWYTGARILSRAGVINGSHRFVFMGLVLPLVYYGFLRFTFLTVEFFLLLIGVEGDAGTHYARMLGSWLLLAMLFSLSGVYTRYMLKQVPGRESSPIIRRDLETGPIPRLNMAPPRAARRFRRNDASNS